MREQYKLELEKLINEVVGLRKEAGIQETKEKQHKSE